MNEKMLETLEFHKILNRLETYAAFSASVELVRALHPTANLDEALKRQAATREARYILSLDADISFAGADDLRPLVTLAERGGALECAELLAVKNTLVIARSVSRSMENIARDVPNLAALAQTLPTSTGLVDVISRTISERGEVLESASVLLGNIRRELKVTYERLISRLEKYIHDSATSGMLQEGIITQRNGRFVLPLRAEFKGRIRAMIHDQSASGATLFIEPLPVVEWNNRYRELQLAERDEILRILRELSIRVAENAESLHLMVAVMAELDLAFACAKYAEDLRATEPLLLPMAPVDGQKHPGSVIQLIQARHPLLDQSTVVPIDLELDAQTYVLVITGPNTGGKTVTLKTVGLLALMAQSGLQIPAQSGSRLSIFQNIFADIGDEQSIEQSLSTFSGHVTNLVKILKHARPTSLVLLDELGAGTDPQEGSALARAVLTHLLERSVTSLIATHYPELKAYAHTTPGVVNASVEFDLKTLRPTYHLTLGLPGRSNALAIAERLGLPAAIINAAKAEINPNDLQVEDLLDEIHRQRDLTRQARQAAETARQQVEAQRDDLTRQLEKIEDERMTILEKARQQAEDEISRLHEETELLRRELARARQPLEVINQVEEAVEALEEEIEQPVVRKPVQKKPARVHGPLRLGEKVKLKSIGQDGVIIALGESDVEVQVGVLRVRARMTDVIRRGVEEETEKPAEPQVKINGRTSLPDTPSPGIELDLRGQRVDEALDALNTYLERAYLSGLPYVRIIHGKGTGKLREAVKEALRLCPHVASHELGGEKEGGDGVTVAKLKRL